MDLAEIRASIAASQNQDATIDNVIAFVHKAKELQEYGKGLHKTIAARMRSRFPDLEAIVSDYKSYAYLAVRFARQNTVEPDMQTAITQKQLIAINLGLAAGLGDPINEPSFDSVCASAIEAAEVSRTLSALVSTCVVRLVPNVTALIGPELASLLLSLTGSVYRLSQIPSCDIKSLGAGKTELMGYSSRDSRNHKGVLFEAPIVREAPPEFRDAAFRDLANKVSLASRVDAAGQNQDGSYGERLQEQISTRLEKREMTTPKMVRPLPVPGLEKRDNRGGRQKRAMRQKFGMGEELKSRTRVAFGVDGQFDELGTQFGASALEGFRRTSAATDAPFQNKIEKKLRGADSCRNQT